MTVAPTQNTAPVHEFRCLYTRDLHKKAKKWHDGSLRYHTFNRRVMVYDDAKNYIGDLHYREAEFGEGVEIQLDRGVKVEVGEPLGETQTDLTPILERQRPEKTVSQVRKPNASCLNSTNPSQRPKSLLEVLGQSQGQRGRARLPLQSPYEQRQTFGQSEQAEHPSKRRRLSSDKENHPRTVVTTVTPVVAQLHQPARLSNPALPSAPKERAPVEFEEVLDISSDEEVRPHLPKDSRLEAGPTKRAKVAQKRQPTSKSTASHQAEKVARNRNVGDRRADSSSKKAASPVRKPAARAATTARLPIKRTARLLLGPPRPRPKLSLLLRSSGPLTSKNSIRLNEPAQPAGSVTNPPLSEQIEPAFPEIDGSPSPDAGHTQPIGGCSHNNSRGDLEHEDVLESSPLFVPEENAAPRPPSPRLLTQDEFPFASQETQGALFQEPSSIAAAAIRPEELNRCSTGARSSHSSPRPDSPPMPLQTLRGVDAPIQSCATRTFRRVLSENDALADEEFVRVFEPTGMEMQSPLHQVKSLRARRSPVKSQKKSQKPAQLLRSVSDTVVMDGAISDERGADIQSPCKSEKGPWTTEEAFLLFECWPSQVEKPDFWNATIEAALPGPVFPGAGSGFPTVITTARQVLRDDVNVL